MDRRLLTGLIVLGVAVAIGVGFLVLGGDDDSGDSPDATNAALSNDERPNPSTDEDGGGKGGGKKGDDNGNSGSNGGNDDGNGGGRNGGNGEPAGPPIEQDPPNDNGGGSDEPVGDPADVSAVTDTLTTYLESIASGDGDGACGQLSESGVETMLKKLAKIAPETKGSPCPQAILLYQGGYGESAVDPTFKSIEVSGGSATAIGPLKEPARLSETGDGWLIDEYGQ